ncbi:MAG: glycoside hydrolase family 15 protein [Gammaproteobacteria bacterium]
MTQGLEQWLDREYRYAGPAMLRSVSPVTLVKERPGFGQTIRPKAGSIVASPVRGAYDPDPDYFFHWFRDSAVIIDAIRLLYEAGDLGDEALTDLMDFVRFSLALDSVDGRTLVTEPAWREKVTPDFTQFLRTDEDLSALHAQAVAADTRVNADGTPDISKWNRPQHDGPALRALSMLRWVRTLRSRIPGPVVSMAEIIQLILSDLTFTVDRWRVPSYDIWEEDLGHHYYTLRVSAEALNQGAEWASAEGRPADARALRTQAHAIFRSLDDFWDEKAGYFRSRDLAAGTPSPKQLDIAVILSAVHSGGSGLKHTARDPRMQVTLAKLEALFTKEYAINHPLPQGRAAAMGRYQGDVYYSGGAYYFSTLGAAELCFLAAAGEPAASDGRKRWIAHGDGFLETTRAFTPDNGDLSEQFDRRTGEQTSAKHLAWSYAAFISCVAARRAVTTR